MTPCSSGNSPTMSVSRSALASRAGRREWPRSAPIRSAEEAARGPAGLKDLFYFDLLARGIWFAKRGFFALSLALEGKDGDRLIAAVAPGRGR